MPAGENLVQLEQAREAARQTIGDGFARDLIDTDELDRRLEAAERATSTAELTALTHDLTPPPGTAVVVAGTSTALVPLGDIPTHGRMTAVLSEAKRTGEWTPARHTKIRAALSSAHLDFRDARLGPGVTEFDVSVFMGEIEVFVPPGMAVDVACTTILGEVDQDERTQTGRDPQAPRIRITGTIVLGSVTVRERLPGESWWDARKRRKAERKRLRRERKRLRKAKKDGRRALPPGD